MMFQVIVWMLIAGINNPTVEEDFIERYRCACIGPASSAVERHLYTVSVGGSIPPLGTNFKVSLEECVSG